jgi:hypothetical protein
LKRWRDKAIKSCKAGRGALVEFASDVIPAATAEAVRSRLERADSTEAIKAAFAEVELSAEFFLDQDCVPVGLVGIAPGRYAPRVSAGGI